MDGFDKMIRKIKIARSPDWWLDDIFSKIDKIENNSVYNFIFYYLNNKILFEYSIKKNHFYYNYSEIFIILQDKYKCTEIEIQLLMKKKIEKYLDIKVSNTYNTLTISTCIDP